MSKWLFWILFFFCGSELMAQSVSGRVVDNQSGAPVAFASISIDNSKRGTYSDIDGAFVLSVPENTSRLIISCIGYETTTTLPPFSSPLVISLRPVVYNMDAATILPGINPAHRIINETIRQKPSNDPEQGIGFSYESYNKFVFTVDTNKTAVEAPRSNANIVLESDSGSNEFSDFIAKQHLLLMESVTERKFRPPDHSSEKVLATRFSGLKNPEFILLASQLQSFSFYEEQIKVGDYTYLSPISKGATRKYLFNIEDTTYVQKDTVFVISYQPRSGKNFDGLKGVLHINTHGYAIQNVTAEPFQPERAFTIRIQQMYERFGEDKWFPVQLNSLLTFGAIDLDNMALVGIGRSYLQNIQLDTLFRKREFDNIAISMHPKAAKQDSSFWSEYRKEPLTTKELNTYHFMDSLGEAEHFDRRLKGMQALMTGEIPVGVFNLDLKRLLAFNSYEGVRLGLGLNTNHKVSEKWQTGAYVGYGFKDKDWKYGGHLNVDLLPYDKLTLGFKYQNDLTEMGGWKFDKTGVFAGPETYYQLFANRYDQVENYEVDLGFKLFRDLTFSTYGLRQFRKSTYDYQFKTEGNELVTVLSDSWQITEAGVRLRFAFKEKFMRMPSYQISMGSKYPIAYLNVAQGLDIFDGTLLYTRMEAMAEKTWIVKNLGRFTFQAVGGMLEGNVPIGLNYNARGSYQVFSIATPFAFETMRVNEFQSSRFVHLHLRHNFEELLFKTEKFAPQISIITSLGYSQIDHVQSHSVITPKAYDKGYFESGFQIDNIIKSTFSGIGVGFFYRYGAYSKRETLDNLAFKITATRAF